MTIQETDDTGEHAAAREARRWAEAEWADAQITPAALLEAQAEWRAHVIAEEEARSSDEAGARFISIPEAARRLGLNHKTTRARVRTGVIPKYGTERAHRVRYRDVVDCFTLRPVGSRSGSVAALRPAASPHRPASEAKRLLHLAGGGR